MFLIVGLVIAVGVILAKWPMALEIVTENGKKSLSFSWPHEESIAYILSDGFFVAGVLVFGMGALKFLRNKGAFDIMSYGVSYVIYSTIPALSINRPEELRNEDFYDYTQRKQAERKPAGDILIAGGVYLLLSAIMLVVYSIIGY